MPNSWGIYLIILFFTFWVCLYFYFVRNFNHWKKKNVPYLKPLPFFGNFLEVFIFKKNISGLVRSLYERTTEPIYGFFVFDEPCLLIREPELIKNILVKDFHIFADRTIANNNDVDPIGSNLLFLLKNPEWRKMRKKISPVFTSGKMKNMYKLISECGENLAYHIEKQIKENPVIDIKEVSAKYTTDAISSTAFGINANCFKYENSEFREVSRRVFNWTIWERAFSTSCYVIAPDLIKFLRLKFIDTLSTKFFRKTFWSTMIEREEKKIVRNDLLDILIEIKKNENINDAFKLEGDKVVAQAVQFFIAGFDTTSSVISFALYELAVNKEIQNKLRESLNQVLDKYKSISYESLAEMEYLEFCIKETMRKYPSLAFLDRRCSENYTIPGTSTKIQKGCRIFISNWGLHWDPKYFPNPELFDPLRFSEENVKSRPAFTYLPFGEGPRNCIGARFAMVSAKSAIARIVTQFEVNLSKQTQHPMQLETKGFLLASNCGILLNFSKV